MMVSESVGRDVLRLIIWHPVRWLMIILPISLSFWVMKLMGDVHFLFSKEKKNLLAKNLSFIEGLESTQYGNNKIIRRYFQNHYIDRLHIFLYPRFNQKVVDRYFPIQGLNILERELAKGRGCILLQGHFGPIQIPLYVLALKGYYIKQIGYLTMPENISKIGNTVSYRLREKYEAEIPAEIISAKSFLKKAYKFLKENNLIMMTGDGAAFGQFIGKFLPIQFLGQRFPFPVGAITIAKRTKSSLLPLFILRESDLSFKIIIEEPLDINYDDETNYNLEADVKKFVNVFERYVARYPCHWHLWDELDERKEFLSDLDSKS